MFSIRGRLILWQVSALVLTGLLASLATYWLAWDGFRQMREHELEQIAYSIVRHGVETEEGEPEDADQGQFLSQIWDADGEILFYSGEDIMPMQAAQGLSLTRWNDQRWRVFVLKYQGLTIQVAHTIGTRIFLLARPVLVPIGILVLCLALVIWLAVGRALAPFERIRRELDQREAQALTPISSQDMPLEIQPMLSALNKLLQRLDTAMEAQRRFIADAAHELRTPLTAIRLQTQLARRGASPEDREQALGRLEEGIERATHLVQQLLLLARMEPGASLPKEEEVRLDQLARRLVAEYSGQAESRGVDLGLAEAQETRVAGDPEALRVLLGNLVDNAVRYTPAGGRVDVVIRATDGGAEIRVEDSGPGIPPEDRERVFDRFHRLAGADIPGSGLGLAIVRGIAERHQARIDLEDSPLGGLRARVSFPARPVAKPAG